MRRSSSLKLAVPTGVSLFWEDLLTHHTLSLDPIQSLSMLCIASQKWETTNNQVLLHTAQEQFVLCHLYLENIQISKFFLLGQGIREKSTWRSFFYSLFLTSMLLCLFLGIWCYWVLRPHRLAKCNSNMPSPDEVFLEAISQQPANGKVMYIWKERTTKV